MYIYILSDFRFNCVVECDVGRGFLNYDFMKTDVI